MGRVHEVDEVTYPQFARAVGLPVDLPFPPCKPTLLPTGRIRFKKYRLPASNGVKFTPEQKLLMGRTVKVTEPVEVEIEEREIVEEPAGRSQPYQVATQDISDDELPIQGRLLRDKIDITTLQDSSIQDEEAQGSLPTAQANQDRGIQDNSLILLSIQDTANIVTEADILAVFAPEPECLAAVAKEKDGETAEGALDLMKEPRVIADILQLEFRVRSPPTSSDKLVQELTKESHPVTTGRYGGPPGPPWDAQKLVVEVKQVGASSLKREVRP